MSQTSPMAVPIPVPVLTYTGPEQLLAEVAVSRRPAVLRGCPLGPCLAWTPDTLARRLAGVTRPVHVTSETNMSFVTKNFRYSTMDIAEMIKLATETGSTEKYYLRAVSDENPRSKPVQLDTEFPAIAADFQLPEALLPREKVFSSVLRVSSGAVRVWTHYDVMDNIYCQVLGHKRAVLWPPHQVDSMYLLGDKSRVADIEAPDPDTFPLFAAAERWEAELGPGDILFIPALWFHNTLAHDFGVAVNVFWRELEERLYDARDPYGNRDHVPAAKAFQSADNIVKNLGQLPPEYRDFYCRRIVDRLRSKCQLSAINLNEYMLRCDIICILLGSTSYKSVTLHNNDTPQSSVSCVPMCVVYIACRIV